MSGAGVVDCILFLSCFVDEPVSRIGGLWLPFSLGGGHAHTQLTRTKGDDDDACVMRR